MTASHTGTEFDLIDVEVHHKSLKNIAHEMAITLMRTSGSPVVTDAKDFSTCILDVDGEQLAFSGFVSFHVSTSIYGVKAVTDRIPREELRPGDAFACNDPHTSGAVHQGDFGVVMPFFHDDELIGWGYVNEHVLDIGGSAISGFAPGAFDSYSESLAFPGTRIVRGGSLEPEWEAFIANNVRMPGTVLNDIRSMIAANNAGQKRLNAVIDEIGYERFKLLNEQGKDLSDRGMRAVIESLPDGTYEDNDWVEYDARGSEELHELRTRVVIKGDEMTLQFRGDPQTDSFINGTVPAIIGQAWTTILGVIAYDIPINQGLWRPIAFDLGPKGTIVNSQAPAPVSMSHIHAGMRVNRMLVNIFSQAASLSDTAKLRSRVAGAPGQNQTYFTGQGVDWRSGAPYVCFSMGVGMPAGGPAQTVADGQESYAAAAMTGCDLPDIESEELSQPGILLWREVVQDSGGAGANRGGLGARVAMSVVYTDKMLAYAYSNTAFVPPNGTGGGHPGAAGSWTQHADTNVEELLKQGKFVDDSSLQSRIVENSEQSAEVFFGRGDIYDVFHGGGGGVGDPLFRAPARVAKDVADGYVSQGAARSAYGVAVNEDFTVDEAATAMLRLEIRTARLSKAPSRESVANAEAIFTPIGIVSEHWVCRACDQELGGSTENWRSHVTTREIEASVRAESYNQRVRKHVDGKAVVVREHFCPSCATALASDVVLEGDPLSPQARLGVYDYLPA